MRRHANLVAYLRQLCGTGLDSRIVMPDVLTTLQHLVPAAGAACFWLDATGRAGDFHADGVLDFAQRQALASGLDRLPAGPLAFTRETAVATDWLASSGSAGPCSGLTRFLLVPGGFPWWLDAWVSVRHPTGESTRLLVLLLRRGHEPAFTARERRRFAELVAHLPALCQPGLMAGKVAPCVVSAHGRGVTGFIVLRDGMPYWTDTAAHDLLQRGLRVAPGHGWPEISPLALACRTLSECAANTEHSEDELSRTVVLPGGMCRLRASRLTPCTGGRNRAVAVSMQWQEAPVLGVLRRLRDTPLSPTQRDIAFRLALGHRRADIRQALDISDETLKTHLRQIRSRLHHGHQCDAPAVAPCSALARRLE